MNDTEINAFLDKIEHYLEVYDARYRQQGKSTDLGKIDFVKLLIDEERYQASIAP
ncbi:hypothetical protein Q9L42_017245 [Methylomarinum sp. Ch1-1]|uniref:Uncharacterized protein n=1 Tax=Methylomarinum roseum TaxID=3067653 RepID=A0AAU7NTV3_9GAMM|nr:hypothetical protein [Methylomarinum sp. Ch1-1]MDP4519919.1 hypothetical protein [Methylomarinum sp. Ch1-1]